MYKVSGIKSFSPNIIAVLSSIQVSQIFGTNKTVAKVNRYECYANCEIGTTGIKSHFIVFVQLSDPCAPGIRLH